MPMDDSTRERDEAWEENVPVIWAVGGADEGGGAERRAHQ